MRKLLLLIVALLAGASGAWATDILPNAVVGTYAFQATTLTAGASDYTISKDGSGNVTISPNNSGYFGNNSGVFTGTLVIKINVPETPTAGVLFEFRTAADVTNNGSQGLYMSAARVLATSWTGSVRGDGNITMIKGDNRTLTAGEHTIIYLASDLNGGVVVVDGTSTLYFQDKGLKRSNIEYKVIYIPAAYAQYITEVHFFSDNKSDSEKTTIFSECNAHIHASQQSGASVTVPSGNTLVIDTDDNLSKYSDASSIAVAAGKTLTLDKDGSSISLSGCGTALQASDITTTVTGDLPAVTLKATAGTLLYTGRADREPTLNGTTLYGVTLAGSKRIHATGNITIENLAGNNQSTATDTYAFYTDQNVSVTLKGDCDFTKKSDGTGATAQRIGVDSGGTLTIADNASVKVNHLFNSTTLSKNADITIGSGATLEITGSCYSPTVTNNGTLTMGGVLTTNGLTLNEGSTINSGSNLSGAISVNGSATLNATADLTLSQAVTVAAGKTLTIDGDNNDVVLTGVVTNNGTINFKNATLTANLNDRSLDNYTFTSCTATAQFTETTDEYKAGGFTITDIPSDVIIKVKKYGATDYETVTPTDGTATISHSVGVSDYSAWLDYTFNESTKATNMPAKPITTIPNGGNAGSGSTLTIDQSNYTYTSANSYNEDGTLKVMSTPYRSITWPTNYTVAVAGNVPDVENGCLVAFGTLSGGYLAILRGDANNKILLVKGKGNTAFNTIIEMTAANATELSHLVVFTKNGNTFTVYLDGVQKAQVEYSETLGGGFQIGSLHGGVTGTGIVRVDAMADATAKAKVFAKAVRVYDYVISADQMTQLTVEFPYTSFGGKYTRTISANSNLSATDAWLNASTQGNVDVPVNAVVEEVTYYPDVEITTTAASTLTVNADMDVENIKFDGAGKLTIASDGTHNINIYGSVTANGPVSVNYDEIDLTAVPVTIGESGSIEFDFSDHDFSSVYDATEYSVTGNIADYDTKVTGVYPGDTEDHTYTLAFDGTSNRYILTVAPTVALKQQQAKSFVDLYEDYIGAGVGEYTIYLGETPYTDYDDFETAVSSWDEVEDYVEPSISFNMPASAFYRFKAAARSANDDTKNWYMGGNADGIYSASTTAAQASDANTIFYLEKDGSGYHPINYVSGLYSNGTANNEVGTKSNFTLTQAIKENNTDLLLGEYKLVNTGTSKTIVMWSNATLNAIDGNNDWSGWTIEPVESLPVTISGIGFSSFYCPVNVVVPEYVTAYTGEISGDYLLLTSIKAGNTIPAETGVILAGEANANVSFTITPGASSMDSDLSGTVAAKATTEGDLVLGYVDGNAGFYKYTGANLAGFKSYISAATAPGVKSFGFNFVETAIQALQQAKEDNIMYDLNGRRVQKAKKGLYIVNGHKVVIR